MEPETGIRYTDASVDITRDQVEHYNGEFHCSCVVITKKGAKVSKTALVTTACKYLFPNSLKLERLFRLKINTYQIEIENKNLI